MTIAYVQQWFNPNGGVTLDGPATTPGSLLIVRGTHRGGGGAGLTVTVTDNAGNTWLPVGPGIVQAGGSGDGFLLYCQNANSTTQVDILVEGGLYAIGVLAEFTGVATTNALIDHQLQPNSSGTTPPPAEVTTTTAGALIYGAASATVSNRTFTLQGTTYTGHETVYTSQMTTAGAYLLDAPPGTYGPSWTLSSGSTTAGMTAAFAPAGGGGDPDPDPDPPARVQQLLGGDGVWKDATTTLL